MLTIKVSGHTFNVSDDLAERTKTAAIYVALRGVDVLEWGYDQAYAKRYSKTTRKLPGDLWKRVKGSK